MHDFIWILIQKCKNFTLMRWRSLPTLSSLAAPRPGFSVQQLIQLNYTYFILWSLKTKIIFVNKTMHNFKIGYNFAEHFLNQTYILAAFNEKASKAISFWKINRFLRSTTQSSNWRHKYHFSKNIFCVIHQRIFVSIHNPLIKLR